MKHIIFLLFLLFMFSCDENTSSMVDSGSPMNIEEEKEKLRYLKEVEWPRAYAEQDTILLDKILGDDFKMIDQSGNWYTKKDELDWIKKNATQNDSFRYEIKRFEILDNGTAIICGTGHVQNDSIKSIYQSSNVLINRNGIWKAVLSHVSGVQELE
ncbi:MAG: nuclear transport factor 2 family protein [Cyclobacteriaceae bacterium]